MQGQLHQFSGSQQLAIFQFLHRRAWLRGMQMKVLFGAILTVASAFLLGYLIPGAWRTLGVWMSGGALVVLALALALMWANEKAGVIELRVSGVPDDFIGELCSLKVNVIKQLLKGGA